MSVPVAEVAHGLADADRRRRSLLELTEAAGSRITRFSPVDASAAVADGGALIDIRSNDARAALGVIPGSLHIPRTVLEWRVAVDSPWRNHHLNGLDQRIILICDHGYSSILAAANLVELGFHRAGDVIGGFEAWIDGALPVMRCPEPHDASGVLPGTGPPDQAADAAWRRQSSDRWVTGRPRRRSPGR